MGGKGDDGGGGGGYTPGAALPGVASSAAAAPVVTPAAVTTQDPVVTPADPTPTTDTPTMGDDAKTPSGPTGDLVAPGSGLGQPSAADNITKSTGGVGEGLSGAVLKAPQYWVGGTNSYKKSPTADVGRSRGRVTTTQT